MPALMMYLTSCFLLRTQRKVLESRGNLQAGNFCEHFLHTNITRSTVSPQKFNSYFSVQSTFDYHSCFGPLTLKGLCGVHADPVRLQLMILQLLSETTMTCHQLSLSFIPDENIFGVRTDPAYALV